MGTSAVIIDLEAYRAQRRQLQRRQQLPKPRFVYVQTPWLNPFVYPAVLWAAAGLPQIASHMKERHQS